MSPFVRTPSQKSSYHTNECSIIVGHHSVFPTHNLRSSAATHSIPCPVSTHPLIRCPVFTAPYDTTARRALPPVSLVHNSLFSPTQISNHSKITRRRRFRCKKTQNANYMYMHYFTYHKYLLCRTGTLYRAIYAYKPVQSSVHRYRSPALVSFASYPGISPKYDDDGQAIGNQKKKVKTTQHRAQQ